MPMPPEPYASVLAVDALTQAIDDVVVTGASAEAAIRNGGPAAAVHDVDDDRRVRSPR
jgi:hypothetical protein